MLKNGESKEKGITMIALVVTIVVLIILAQVSVQLIFGESGLITKSKYTKFVNEYSEVEEVVKLNIVNSTIDKETQEKEYPIIGEKIIQIKDSLKEAIEKVNEEEISIETLNLYKIDLEKLNNNIRKEYVIDTDTERIYLLNGEKIGGSIYHMPEIESSQTMQKIKKYKITFDSNGGETETENREIEENNEYGDLPIPTKERYIFLGWYTEKEEGTKIEETDIITSDITLYAHWQDTLESYVQDGLIVLYDGIKNTRNGHSSDTNIWENLASTSINGNLKNFNNTEESGWTDNSLILDGDDDWVQMEYIHNSNMTIEIVAKPLDILTDDLIYTYIASYQYGGIGISIENGKNESRYYISGYKTLPSEETIKLNQIYSMSTGYDGNNLYFRENEEIYTNPITVKIGKPESSTVFAIGTNPEGTSFALTSSEAILKMEVYSVRIYNRCLKQDEINYNYQMDKTRYGL